MGLDNFDIAPDNKGGRDPKPEDEEENKYGGRKVNGAYTQSDDTEEFWRLQYEKHIAVGEPTSEDLVKIAGSLHVLPRTVKQKFTEYEIHEYDEFKHDEPSYSFSGDDDTYGDSNLVSLVNDAV